ncbi:MAG: SdrD B-like domain-containing protein, partial [Bacteroidota bacterium]
AGPRWRRPAAREEGEWQVGSNSGLTYNPCNNTIVIDALNACGTFTLASDGTGNNLQCGNFSLTVNIEVEAISNNTISNKQTVCYGSEAAPLTTTATSSSGNLTYQWQSSTTSCMVGFTDISGATSAEFSPGVIVERTYYRLITTTNGNCSSGLCRDTSNCVNIHPVCCLNISKTESINCQVDTSYTADWLITVQGGSPTDNGLSYQRNEGTIQNATLTGATNQVTFSDITADGNGTDTLKIWMTNDPSCGDTVILSRPLPCPTVLFSNAKCYDNLALGQNATASPVNFGTSVEDGNDDNTDGVFSNGSVYHSQQVVNPFWQIDFGNLQTIDSIEIWNRTDACCTGALNGAIVEILDASNAVIFSDTIDTLGPNIGFATGGLDGQTVRLQKNTNGGNASLAFAEMRILQAVNCPIKPTELCNSLAATQIGGTVFQDYNFDGIINQTDTTGLQGISVQIFDCDNNLVGTTFTDVNGNYRFDKMALDSTYRVEFNLPENIANWAKPTLAGTDNGTTIQFVESGNCANLGVANPDDYCQANPDLFLPCYEAGTGMGGNANNAALISIKATESGENPTKTQELSIGDIGSTWGVAIDKEAARIFTSTVLKRAVGTGEGANANETGYIYFQDRSGGTPTFHKFNLQGIMPTNGGSARSGGNINLGSVLRNRVSGAIIGDYDISDSNNTPMIDLDAFAKAGKVAFGDIDVTEDQQYLWMVNLRQSALIRLDLSATTATLDGADAATLGPLTEQFLINELVGLPSCGNGDGTIPYDTTDGSEGTTPAVNNAGATGVLRPWALEFFRGKGYLGLICDASISKDPDDLRAFVLSFDPNNIEAGFTEEFSFDLDVSRGANTITSNAHIVYNWQPWYDQWDANLMANGLSPNKQIGFAQPILSDLEFSGDGSITLGFSDRWSLQNTIGHRAPEAGAGPDVYDFEPHGSIIKVCRQNGNYHLEGGTACSQSFTTKNPVTRFYDTKRGDGRPYGAMGSLVIHPETREIIVPYIDPFPPNESPGPDYFSTQGIHFFDYQTGSRVDWLRISGPSNLLSEKGQALGDIEKDCDQAPVEIGNYVWDDQNKNGIQDACEPPLDSVILVLFNSSGQPVGYDTTDAKGQYYFKEENIIGSTPVLTEGSTFHIVISGSVSQQFSNEQLTINGQAYTLTTQDSFITTTTNSDLIDSDAALGSNGLPFPYLNGFPYITTVIGNYGVVNHSLDFGFSAVPKYYDYGDLPDLSAGTTDSRNYETYDSTGGPSHLIVEGLFLGDTVDVDTDGKPHPMAIGDDLDGVDDEDGVQILNSIDIITGRTVRFPIEVTNTTSDTAYLKAWIDWNADGDFDEPNELVANFKDLADGVFPAFIETTIPDAAVTGDLVGFRVRLSNSPNTMPTGRVNSGEVEDYSISVNCPTSNCLTAEELLKKE